MSLKMRGTSRKENVIWDETHGCGVKSAESVD
jgi:hypothetical protein